MTTFLFSLLVQVLSLPPSVDYHAYHLAVIEIEEKVLEGAYAEALAGYDALFEGYPFVFLRDYKVAAQLAAYTNDRAAAYRYMRLGIQAGWSLKAIKKEKALAVVRKGAEWEAFQEEYAALHAAYVATLDMELREEVKVLIDEDQKYAFRAFIRLTDASRERYAERAFAPHSEGQLVALGNILEEKGYPGERLIGNNYWASTILSHHNSISKAYNQQDEAFFALVPQLDAALRRGEVSLFEYALMADWRTAGLNDHQRTEYGFIGAVHGDVQRVNENRAKIGLRSLQLRNALVDVQEATGINFYLPGGGWQPGKIAWDEE